MAATGRVNVRHRLAAGIVAGLTLAGTACGNGAGGTSPNARAALLSFGTVLGYTNLDPAKDALSQLRSITNESLLHMRPDGSFAPALATSWRYVPGSQNKDFELTLRNNAKFADGSPVNAQAVKAWFDYYAQVTGPYQSYLGLVSTEVSGGSSVRLHLKSSNPAVPFLLSDQNTAGAIAAPRCVASPALFASDPCGAGPYQLDAAATVTNDHYTYVPNRYYYDSSRIHFARILVKVIPTYSSLLQAIESGQIDVAVGDASIADAAVGAGLNVAHAPGDSHGFSLDVKGVEARPLSDLRVRQALNYAIDRKAVAAAVGGKYARPTSEWASFDGFDPKLDNQYRYDPTRARKLLADAGYPNGFSVDNVTVGGADPQLNLTMAQATAKYWDAIGVHLNMNVLATPAAFVQAVLKKPAPIQTVAVVASRPSYLQYATFYQPGGNYDRLGGGWDDPEITKDYQAALTATDPSSYWKQITARAGAQAYYVPVVVTDKLLLSSKRIKGVQLSATAAIFDPSEWSS